MPTGAYERLPAMRIQRLLDLDAGIAEALGPAAAQARNRVGVATARLAQGTWDPRDLVQAGDESFALLVCDGLIVRELDLAGTTTADLVGPGDIVDAGQRRDTLLVANETWHVSGRATVASLDSRLLAAIHAWPTLGTHLIARTAR